MKVNPHPKSRIQVYREKPPPRVMVDLVKIARFVSTFWRKSREKRR